MSFISDLFDGSKGAGFQAAAATNLINPVGADRANTVLDTQQNLSNQLAPGIGQAQQGFDQQQQFVNALNAQNGLANQSDVYNQLAGVAAGTGTNPAQAMLNQQTGANVANQAALMAGQRGVGANPGLIARQIAQQGAGIQQQAVGQGATMQANQSLNALGQMGNISGQQVGNQAQGIGMLNQFGQAQQGAQLQNAQNLTGQTLGQLQAQNAGNIATQSNINTTNAGVAGINAKKQGDIFSGLTNAVGNVAGMVGLAQGGMVPSQKPQADNLHDFMMKAMGPDKFMVGDSSGHKETVSYLAQSIKGMPPKLMAKGGNVVPGKPAVPGAVDSYKNDKVKAVLSPGEIVLPRSVTMSKDPVNAAAQFVAAIMARKSA